LHLNHTVRELIHQHNKATWEPEFGQSTSWAVIIAPRWLLGKAISQNFLGRAVDGGRSAFQASLGSARLFVEKLRWNLWQHFHSPDFGRDPKIIAQAFFHPQHAGMAANPALLAGSQFGRQDQD
jgi:hypothetical protein